MIVQDIILLVKKITVGILLFIVRFYCLLHCYGQYSIISLNNYKR
jgi:hypothetical protein